MVYIQFLLGLAPFLAGHSGTAKSRIRLFMTSGAQRRFLSGASDRPEIDDDGALDDSGALPAGFKLDSDDDNNDDELYIHNSESATTSVEARFF